jgi:hypothetical protein
MGEIMLTDQVERIGRPNRGDFYNHYVLPGKPAVISGAIDEWRAISSWSIDHFKSIAGNTEIRVEISPTNYFPPVHDGPVNMPGSRIEKMTFGQYIDRITSKRSESENCYFAQQPLDILFPQLTNDIKSTDYFEKKRLISTNLWFAGAGNITPLHYDLAHNLFAQVIGSKRFVLFPPDQSRLLYPFPKSSSIAHFSRVNVDNPDLGRFPQFQHARPLECILEPGDILFIPIFWWHQVYSLNISVSISFWSSPGWTNYLNPQAMRLCISSAALSIRRLKKRAMRIGHQTEKCKTEK